MSRLPVPRAVHAQDEESSSSLASLYERWRQPLIRMLRRHTSSPADAEDATQDLFVRMASQTSSNTTETNRPYLAKAAQNAAIDRWRRQGGSRDQQTLDWDSSSIDSLHHAGDTTQDHAVQAQTLERLNQALAELPERQRQAFVLHRIEGFTVAETAQQMGISARMAVKHLSRGLAYCQVRVLYASSDQMGQLRNLRRYHDKLSCMQDSDAC